MPHNRQERLERLLEICRRLSTTLELQPVLQTVIEAAMELTQSEAASILLYDGETNQLSFAAATPEHWEQLKAQTVPLSGSIAGRAMVERQPIIEANVPQAERHFRDVDARLQFTTRNLLAVPLIREGQPLGVLEVLNKRTGAFLPEDVESIGILASHAAVALHNARLMKVAREAYRSLEQLDRMKSDFVAIASHELRTPLGVILGYASHLEAVVGEEHRSAVRAILRAAHRLKDIVEELSHLENDRQGKMVLRPRWVDLRALVSEMVERFQFDADSRQVTLEARLPETEVRAEVDVEKVRILLRHLLDNALIFTNPGGRVVVEVQAVDDQVHLIVSDTGVGIPADALPHIFERFYQVEKHLTRRHGGLGMGLSTAKAMVEAHGGTIWAESEEGQGTTIVAVLPRSPDEAPSQDFPLRA